MAGNTKRWIVLKIVCASLSLNRLHLMDCPIADEGKILFPFVPMSASILSLSSSFSSRDRMKSRQVSCSITVSGFVSPPAHISVQILSTLFLMVPVIISSILAMVHFLSKMHNNPSNIIPESALFCNRTVTHFPHKKNIWH